MTETRELGELRIEVEGAKSALHVGHSAVDAIRRDAQAQLSDHLDDVWSAVGESVDAEDFERLRTLHEALAMAKNTVDVLVALAPLPDADDEPER